jgi:predicted TIM-barrel fold metal-dependent hydrolase
MIVDFQAHVFPPAYVSVLEQRDGDVTLEPPDPFSGMRYLYDRRLDTRINTATLQGQVPERRLEHMNDLGVDIQVVSIPPPGADRFEESRAVAVAWVPNNALPVLGRADSKRLVGLYTLPSASTPAALLEIERATDDPDLRGFGCYSNLNGRPLDDEALFPIYERIARLGQPIYMHPTAPLATEATGLDIMPVLIYGPDRLVFGTNYPYGPDEGCVFVRNSLDAVRGLGLPQPETDQILGGTAARLLGIEA